MKFASTQVWLQLLCAAVLLTIPGCADRQSTPPHAQQSQSDVNTEAKRSEPTDRINILLFGIGGADHAGGMLADSIVVVSIDPTAERATLLSVPRDLYVPGIDGKSRRINTAHALGNRTGEGGAAMKLAVQQTLGVPIHHYVRADFAAFIEAVDAVGGVDVHFEEPLYDAHFNHEFGVLDFPAGTHTLDGRTALYAARSRMTSKRGDFDRSRRQRAILVALRDKVLASAQYSDPTVVAALFGSAKDHLQTDMSILEMWRLYRTATQLNAERIQSVGLGDVDALLEPARIDGAAVLVPASGNLLGIRDYVRALLTG